MRLSSCIHYQIEQQSLQSSVLELVVVGSLVVLVVIFRQPEENADAETTSLCNPSSDHQTIAVLRGWSSGYSIHQRSHLCLGL